jgi:hypothetical protein
MKLIIRLGVALAVLLTALVIAPATGSAAVSAPARGTTVQATEAVNLRSEPNLSAGIVVTAAAGDTASALGRTSGDFIQVYYRNHTGWTHSAYWNAVPGLWVNGHRLSSYQEAATRWIADNTLARVPGTLSEKLTMVSRGTWWSLKEGILSQPLTSVHRFSNCADTIYDPLHSCGTTNWQVGIGGFYMANGWPGRVADIEAMALQLYPNWTVNQVLAHTASYSGYPAGSDGHNRVLGSTGSFRTSWLLRNHGVSFAFNAPFITPCLSTFPDEWCFGGWGDALTFAGSQAAITRSIADLRGILYAIRPI